MAYYGDGPSRHEYPVARSTKELYGQYIVLDEESPRSSNKVRTLIFWVLGLAATAHFVLTIIKGVA